MEHALIALSKKDFFIFHIIVLLNRRIYNIFYKKENLPETSAVCAQASREQ
jgi:hypothetical protein